MEGRKEEEVEERWREGGRERREYRKRGTFTITL